MDFIEGLPVSKGKDKIFVVVDRLKNYAHFMGINKTTLSNKLLKYFVKIFTNYMDFPKSSSVTEIPNSQAIFWKEFCKQFWITLNMSSPYHPQTDGQTKVVNKCVEAYLRSFVTNKQNRWLQ